MPEENITDIEFVDATVGMNIPKNFIPAIEKVTVKRLKTTFTTNENSSNYHVFLCFAFAVHRLHPRNKRLLSCVGGLRFLATASGRARNRRFTKPLTLPMAVSDCACNKRLCHSG